MALVFPVCGILPGYGSVGAVKCLTMIRFLYGMAGQQLLKQGIYGQCVPVCCLPQDDAIVPVTGSKCLWHSSTFVSSRLSASENLNVIHDLTSFLRSKCRKSVKYTSCHIMVKTKR